MSKTANVNCAATAMETATFRIPVLSCRKTGRVVFLEAGKDFVDILFSFLLLPVGSIIHMLASAGVQVKGLSGISSLFESVEKLDCSFVHVDKKHLLQPRPAVARTGGSIGLLQGLEAAEQESLGSFELPATYYRCNSNACTNLSSTAGTPCTACAQSHHRSYYLFNQPVSVLPGDLQKLKQEILEGLPEEHPVKKGACSTGQGFVRDNITYMVTDQLEVMPSTTIRGIKVLNKLKVATLSDLESGDINANINHILQLLESAMTSSSCLNDVFGKK